MLQIEFNIFSPYTILTGQQSLEASLQGTLLGNWSMGCLRVSGRFGSLHNKLPAPVPVPGQALPLNYLKWTASLPSHTTTRLGWDCLPGLCMPNSLAGKYS